MFASTGFKDSIKNIEETKVFTCSLATEKLFNKMNYSSASTKYGQDEFELSATVNHGLEAESARMTGYLNTCEKY